MFTRTINGDLALALVQPSFAKDYLRIVQPNQADFARFLPWALQSLNEDFFKEYFSRALTNYAKGVEMPCSIIYKGTVVGNISFNDIDYSLKKAKIGYWLDPEYRGRGIVTQSVSKLIEIGFNELGLTKIKIRASTENVSSRAVPERLGFELEGIIKQAENIDGKLIDHAVYAIYNY